MDEFTGLMTVTLDLVPTTVFAQNKAVSVTSSISSFASVTDVPSPKGNPYLFESKFHQGTFYQIFGPIIGGILFFYLVGVIYRRIQARRNAKGAEAIEDEYEMNHSIMEPFEFTSVNDFEDNGSSYFSKLSHQKSKNSNTLTEHPRQKSLSFTALTNPFQSDEYNMSTRNIDASSVSLPFTQSHEPSKGIAPASTVTKKSGTHFHRRRTSSMVLDDFINTGSLPLLEGEQNMNNADSRQVENHTMYEWQNNSYIADSDTRNTSPVRYSRSCSPVRRN